LELAGAAPKPGENGRAAIVFAQGPPPGALVMAKLSVGVAGGLPDHGVITARLWFGLQVGGLLSTARAPPSSFTTKFSTWDWGVSAMVVVSWPVCGLALTLPIRRTSMP
jgi:hypothetical protein